MRKASQAGSFYPAEVNDLVLSVDSFLACKNEFDSIPKALIVPHAGYIYSGKTAGKAYSLLKNSKIKRIIILGPAHRISLKGITLCESTSFETPLGSVPVDRELQEKALTLPFVSVLEQAHLEEHCIEVQLPFLQRISSEFSILPALVGRAEPFEVLQFLEELRDSADLIIVSSDLSHYNSCERAKAFDGELAKSIKILNANSILPEQACGHTAIKGLLLYARKYDLYPEIIDMCNSCDTNSDTSRVVGYGSFAFF